MRDYGSTTLEAPQMTDDNLPNAVEQRGYRLVPLETVSAELRWIDGAGSLENRLATVGRLHRHKRPDRDPAYASRVTTALAFASSVEAAARSLEAAGRWVCSPLL
jgi:hypothetical protein